jgi:hypothetical protein
MDSSGVSGADIREINAECVSKITFVSFFHGHHKKNFRYPLTFGFGLRILAGSLMGTYPSCEWLMASGEFGKDCFS